MSNDINPMLIQSTVPEKEAVETDHGDIFLVKTTLQVLLWRSLGFHQSFSSDQKLCLYKQKLRYGEPV